ncbi:ATP-binding protein [Roseateles oligotrophus]|uniref:AAA family ATPase n=1 Tax=Roseateles oligotrophus TaxID=1769250 RepID=A0ABT2Y9Z5_9BURK|nr:adenylate/guanylate cyclase domain-containing protein [Roseateles oligotrophus]MCV2367124.1 AAA family ATPase [Roseateles oligotrophus]
MSELEQIKAGIAALEAQRSVLGDAVVEVAVAAMNAKLLALRSQNEAVAAAVSQPVQQLKQVTVLFVDAVGSTAMGARLDPEDIQLVMDGALQRFTRVVQQFKGRVLQYAGDSLLAAFGADESHEDDPESAVRAGLAILDQASQHAQALRQEHGITGFNIRVGINTGPVLLGGGVDAEGSIRGAAVNIAARMEQTAPPGGLRISHDTYRHVRGLFKVSEEAPLQVKGSAQALQTYLVLSAQPRAFRVRSRGIEGVETRMVAREAELEQLQDAFRSLSERAGLVSVLVVAEAGLGKSRLLYEFEDWVEAQGKPVFLLRGRADPRAQQRPYGMLRDMITWHLQISEDDKAETASLKIVEFARTLFEDGVGGGALSGEVHAHLLGQLIGLDFSDSPHVRGILDDARQIRNRAFHAAAQILRALSARDGTPALLLLDDLQWVDDGSLDFINYLLQVNRDAPCLVLCLTRPALFERRSDWVAVEAVHQRIDLQPLDRRGSRELVNVLLQRLEHVPAALRELITGGAEGNPFYMEELVRMLIDDGAIQIQGERWELISDKLLAAHVPPTLTGVLQARLDSLPAAERLALQQASVIGFVFWDQALAALDMNSLQPLEAQVQHGLVVPRPHAAFEGQREYAFKHQILHQVTYDSMLRRNRREYHAKAAAWLGQLSDQRASETLGPAADHYERAGDAANALAFFVRAAEDAAARFANQAMLAYVARALPLVPEGDALSRWRLIALRERYLLNQGDRAVHAADLSALDQMAEQLDDDDKRMDVALRRANVFRAMGDFAAAADADRRGLSISIRLPESRRTVALRNSLATSLTGEGNYTQAKEVAEQGLTMARKMGDFGGESRLINALGLISMEQGDLPASAEYFERGLVMVRESCDRAVEGLRLSNLGSVYSRLGEYAKARLCLDQGLSIARAVGQRATEAVVLLNIGSVAHLQFDDTSALAFASMAYDAATASGQADLAAYARLVAGHAELGLDRLDSARQAYAESRNQLQGLKMRPQQVLDPVSGLARVALAQGQRAEALAYVEEILLHMAAGGSFDGAEEPLLLPLTCYQVLLAVDDERAIHVLANAHAELQLTAARIGDVSARQGFFEHVPHNRAIIEAWLLHQATAAGAFQSIV